MSGVAVACATLDRVFRGESADMIEEAIRPYRPVLSHAIVHQFRHNLWERFLLRTGFEGWIEAVPREEIRAVGPLSAVQVSLLGGWRPMRCVHETVSELDARIDNGDRGDLAVLGRILYPCFTAVDSLAVYERKEPPGSPEEAERRLRELFEIAVAAQYAAMVAALTGAQSRISAEEDARFAPRYFLAALQAFQRVSLSRADQAAFSDFFLSGARIKDLAEETGAKVSLLVERRRTFLERLSRGLRAAIAVIAQEPPPEGTRPAWPALPPPEAPAEPPRALPAKKRTRKVDDGGSARKTGLRPRAPVSGGAAPRRKR